MSDLKSLIETFKSELNSKNKAPLYRRLKRGIRRAVSEGSLKAEDALPSERDLASLLGVSRITIRRAVGSLVEEGLLNQQQGAGTFVSSRLEQPLSGLTSYTEDMKARGMVPGVQWLERNIGTASPDEAANLGIEPGSKIARLYRLRTADDRPMCLEHAIIPSIHLPDPESVKDSLYALLSDRGIRPVKAQQSLRAELFSIEQARLLSVQPGSPCLYIERRSFLSDGSIIEFVSSHYRGDSYTFVTDLQL